jgi:hypothetical protein
MMGPELAVSGEGGCCAPMSSADGHPTLYRKSSLKEQTAKTGIDARLELLTHWEHTTAAMFHSPSVV